MKKMIFLLLTAISMHCYAQTSGLTGGFDSDGAFDKWTAWSSATFTTGENFQYRAMLSASPKGCKVTVEIKNDATSKIKGKVVFGYNIANVSTPMTDLVSFSAKPGEVASVSYVSKYCGAKNNDYAACYNCNHEFKFFSK